MKVSDYIVETLKKQNIYHYFGYQGTMIAHFVDSIGKDEEVFNHCCYNEQSAAFAACGHAKITGECAVAYATSGPGAINLLSGIADAYYDSVPVLFITGQVNTYEYTNVPELRQQAFQETDVVSMAKPITKFAVKIEKEEDVPYYLEKCIEIAMEGRKGPVLIDLPMNIQRGQIDCEPLKFEKKNLSTGEEEKAANYIIEAIRSSERPILLMGNGLAKSTNERVKIKKAVEKLNIPVITSMLGRDLLLGEDQLNYGYVGAAYGHRYANLLIYKKADLIISLGCSMCRRQTGTNTERFAENAKIIRVDIDATELKRYVHKDEMTFIADANKVLQLMSESPCDKKLEWLEVCKEVKCELEVYDTKCESRYPNKFLEVLSNNAEDDAVFSCDVGQHQIWSAQSINIHGKQRMIFSGGHGAMGFALPAGIGAQYASGCRVYCICGDGAMQMNIQEYQWIVRENLDITIIVMNNNSLGLIQQQQDDFFDGKHYGATASGGFLSPDFAAIGRAYGIESYKVYGLKEFEALLKKGREKGPMIIEVMLPEVTKAHPKTYFGEEMYNQKPYVDGDVLKRLSEL